MKTSIKPPQARQSKRGRKRNSILRRFAHTAILLTFAASLFGPSSAARAQTPTPSSNVQAILESMTPEERKYAELLDGSRRKRIARGSGTAVEDVNRLLKQFGEMQRMLKMVGQMTGEPIAAPPRKKKKSPFSLMK